MYGQAGVAPAVKAVFVDMQAGQAELPEADGDEVGTLTGAARAVDDDR